jgi:hypothetical protein
MRSPVAGLLSRLIGSALRFTTAEETVRGNIPALMMIRQTVLHGTKVVWHARSNAGYARRTGPDDDQPDCDARDQGGLARAIERWVRATNMCAGVLNHELFNTADKLRYKAEA